MQEVHLPHLGEGIDSVEVAIWHAEPGSSVTQGDDLLEVTTDKASFNVASTANGRLQEQCVEPGQEISIGQLVAVIKESEDEGS